MRFSEQTEELDLQTPCLGEHNSEVLLSLGYTANKSPTSKQQECSTNEVVNVVSCCRESTRTLDILRPSYDVGRSKTVSTLSQPDD